MEGLSALVGTVSSAGRAPVIIATRLLKGSANPARGAVRLSCPSAAAEQVLRTRNVQLAHQLEARDEDIDQLHRQMFAALQGPT